MAKTNPLRRRVGRYPETMAIWLARTWDFNTMLRVIPQKRAPVRKMAAMANKKTGIAHNGHMKQPFTHDNGNGHIGHTDDKIGNDLADRSIQDPAGAC